VRSLDNSKQRFGVAAVAAVAAAAALIGASQLSAHREPATTATSSTTTTDIHAASASSGSPFAGIPQSGAALGSPAAPVTLVEYADLQCPSCAQWARDTLPVLVRDYVRPGKLRIVFKGLAFIGPDSEKALRTAIVAGQHDHLWEMVHGFYARQGTENAGWVSDDLIREIAGEIPGLDGNTLLAGSSTDLVQSKLDEAAASAQAAGVRGTPSFEVGRTGGPRGLLQLSSLGPEGLVPSIESELTR
jgi:protein-disulfide isomerase